MAGQEQVITDLLQIALQVEAGADADAQEVDELTAQLRRRLLELDVRSVDRIRAGEAPPRTRAGDVLMLGGLLMTLTKSPQLLKMVIGAVHAWLGSHQGRSVELQIEGDSLRVTGVSSDEQRQLITLFVERHSH